MAVLRERSRRSAQRWSSEAVYAVAGITRQGYAQYRHRASERALASAIVISEVQRIRSVLPMSGGRKLWKELGSRRYELGVHIGRNRLFGVLRAQGMLIRPKRSYARTTQSRHGFAVARNEVRGLAITHPNQVWVSDITYIRTRAGFVYASLITDAYSRKIIGYDLSGSLSIEGSLRSLGQAVRQCGHREGVIHHSDRGVQYCSHEYRRFLHTHGILASMTAGGNPYENAIAERVNGILKQEFGLGEVFATAVTARQALREAVELYNTRRLHQSLNYCVPAAIHACCHGDSSQKPIYNPVNV